MSKIISTTIVNPNNKEDTCALVQVDGQELYYLLRPIEIIGGYTISFWVKATASETIVVHYGEQNKEFAISTEWQRVIFSFEAKHIDNVMIQFTTGDYYIYNTQLENGDVATDYSQSPEDIQEQLKDIEKSFNLKYSEITQSLGSISLMVGEQGNSINRLESEIRIQANSISQKVSRNSIISEINQTAEQIKIQAEKIDLIGQVTAEMLNVTNLGAISANIGKLSIDQNGILTSKYLYEKVVEEGSLVDDYININYEYWAPSVNDYKIVTGKTTLGFEDMTFEREDSYTDPHLTIQAVGTYQFPVTSISGITKYSANGITYDKTFNGYIEGLGGYSQDISHEIRFVDVIADALTWARCEIDFHTTMVNNLEVNGAITKATDVTTLLGASLNTLHNTGLRLVTCTTSSSSSIKVSPGDILYFWGQGSGGNRCVVQVFSTLQFFYEYGSTIGIQPVSSYIAAGNTISLTLANGILTVTKGAMLNTLYCIHYHIGD